MARKRGQLTAEVQATVCEIISKGGSFAAAGAAAGISEAAIHLWRRQWKEARRGRKHDFAVAVDRAREEGVATAIRQFWRSFTEATETVEEIVDAAGNVTHRKIIRRPPSADAALRFLERFGGEDWHLAKRIAIGGDESLGPVRVSSRSPAGEDWEALLTRATLAETRALGEFRKVLEGRTERPGEGESMLQAVKPVPVIEGKAA